MRLVQIVLVFTLIQIARSAICCISYKEIFKQKICLSYITCEMTPSYLQPNYNLFRNLNTGYSKKKDPNTRFYQDDNPNPRYGKEEYPKITIASVEYSPNPQTPKTGKTNFKFGNPNTKYPKKEATGTAPGNPSTEPPPKVYPKISLKLKKILDDLQVLYYDTLPQLEDNSTWDTHSGVVPVPKVSVAKAETSEESTAYQETNNNEVNSNLRTSGSPDTLFTAPFNCEQPNSRVTDTEGCATPFEY